MTITMYDSITPAALPRGAKAVAGYVDGRYANFPALLARFYPGAHCLSITVRGNEAAVADCETGAMSPAQAGPWVRTMLQRGHWRPCVYASESAMPQVKSSLAGVPRGSYRLWVAAYPGSGPNVPPGYDAHQYTDHGPHGENYDISVCRDDFFPAPPPPPPKPSPKPHPKVTAAGIAGALTTALAAFLTAHGIHVVHLTTAETAAITTLAATLAGYFKSA